jgi:alpha-maltose-1-phosphate synthase
MRIVQTVFGVFHHFDLARQLEARGHLECVFSTWPHARLNREGIPRSKVKTFPWIHTPEYLMRRYGISNRWLDDQMGYANALAFDEFTLRHVKECDALIALSGSSLKTGKMVQARGAAFICDRGSSHQRYQQEIVLEEYRLWDVDLPVSDSRDTIREEAIYKQADAIVVPSSFAARSFLEMGVPEKKVHTIPLGVRLELFSPVSHPPADCFEVLFVGSVSLRKGVQYLVKAFADLKCPRKRLRIIGGMSKEMPAILAQLSMMDIEVVGTVPQSRLAEIMSSSHVLVLPSIEDGFGLVLGQALASGCPVIASVNTGGPDMISDGIEGFIVPIRDSKILTERLQCLADNPELQVRMREAGLMRVGNLGGWNSYGDQWETLLLDLTRSTRNATVPV